jgi:hypothetical protein
MADSRQGTKKDFDSPYSIKERSVGDLDPREIGVDVLIAASRLLPPPSPRSASSVRRLWRSRLHLPTMRTKRLVVLRC